MPQVPRHHKLPTIEAPSVSVVVPVYNEARVLPVLTPQLRKLAGRCELVVADGGSCDVRPRSWRASFACWRPPKAAHAR